MIPRPMFTKQSTRVALAAALFALLAGCGSTPEVADSGDWQSSAPPEPLPGYQGSIFQAGRGISLFVDNRARQVGDAITITLQEQTDASKQSSTATSKDQEIDIPGPTIFGRGVTKGGVPILTTDLEADQEFSGEGSSSQSNRLSGSITVTVSEVLANGNLRVRGEKWLTINQGEEFIRLTGIVRPQDIDADNSVPSFKLADARITYAGKGALADANRMGWLGRFFQSVLSPF